MNPRGSFQKTRASITVKETQSDAYIIPNIYKTEENCFLRYFSRQLFKKGQTVLNNVKFHIANQSSGAFILINNNFNFSAHVLHTNMEGGGLMILTWTKRVSSLKPSLYIYIYLPNTCWCASCCRQLFCVIRDSPYFRYQVSVFVRFIGYSVLGAVQIDYFHNTGDIA